MKCYSKKLKKRLENKNKFSAIFYVIIRLLIIICMVREIIIGNFENALLCVLSLILLLLPFVVEEKFKISLPPILEIIIFLFIFSAEILGEVNNFYGLFHNFDNILHTLNGFLAATFGFSLIYLLNENIESFKLSPFFVSLVAFCFSMTIGVLWEFFEYGMDYFLGFDMQKEEYVYKLRSVELDPDKDNNVIKVDGIDYTILYDKDGDELVKIDGYLDIGLHDTMNDLFVNFIGAIVFSALGYLYIVNRDMYNLAGIFLTQKVKN